MFWKVLDTYSIRLQLAISAHSFEFGSLKLRESPLFRNVDLLSSWKLELGPSQSLDYSTFVLVVSPNRHKRLTNLDASHGSLRLTKSSTHSSLQTISAYHEL